MKEQLIELTEQAITYEHAHESAKGFDIVKSKARGNVSAILNSLGIEKHDLLDTVNEQGKYLRTQLITKKSIIYDNEKLLQLLKEKGKDTFKRAVVLSVDQTVLDDLYNEGIISYDELNDCVDKINETVITDIRRVKADLKGELKQDDGKFRFNPQGVK
jgi:hypothetical protein